MFAHPKTPQLNLHISWFWMFAYALWYLLQNLVILTCSRKAVFSSCLISSQKKLWETPILSAQMTIETAHMVTGLWRDIYFFAMICCPQNILGKFPVGSITVIISPDIYMANCILPGSQKKLSIKLKWLYYSIPLLRSKIFIFQGPWIWFLSDLHISL